MSSHILAEVAKLAQRIGIIHQGRLLQEMDVTELESQRRERLVLRTRDQPSTLKMLLNAGLSAEITENDTIEIKEKAAIEKPDHIASLLVEAGLPPVMLHVEQEDLEEYFLRLVGMPGGEA